MLYKHIFLKAIALIGVFATLILYCSGGGSTGPGQTVVAMNGLLAFPPGSTMDPNDVTVALGAYDTLVASDGSFIIKGKKGVPGLAMACDADNNPLLMAIVPNPSKGLQFTMDVNATALALVFLCPFVAISSSGKADTVLTTLESLPELSDLVDLLTTKLAADPQALIREDAEIDSAVSRVVLAYVNSYPEEAAPSLPATMLKPAIPGEGAVDGPTIEPSWEKGGLRVTWEGGSKYRLTNSYGRWLYCCTSQDTFPVFPNGDLLDCLKLQKPFPASKRDFTLNLTPGDTAYVDTYGYGFWTASDNAWDSLTPPEKTRAHIGGFCTICFELCSHLISVITNSTRLAGNDELASGVSASTFALLFSDGRLMERITAYIHVNDPWGLSWFLTKHIISKLCTSQEYRDFIFGLLRISITDDLVPRLAASLNLIARGTILTNNVASLFKTALAFQTGRFWTGFKIWREITDFGSVRGQVADHQGGEGISGATVVLGGDDNNPLNPPHEKTTDESGNFRFDNIGIGDKTLTASKSGYGSSTIGVTIVKDAEAVANITLDAQQGNLSGKVVNEILVENGVNPPDFRETVDITARKVSGTGQEPTTHAFNGAYSLNLPTGTWWVKAEFDTYYPDSFQITVSTEGQIQAPRNLVLRPNQYITGQIYINRDNDPQNTYEREFEITFSQVGLYAPQVYAGGCPLGGNPLTTMEAIGVRGTTQSSYDAIEIGFNTVRITNNGTYAMGAIDKYACSGSTASWSTWYATTREYCQNDSEGLSGPMSYTFWGDPDQAGCNCGITAPGNLFLTYYGTELTDSVVGGIVVYLSGWNGCDCKGDDDNHDGHIDAWRVNCAKAYLRIDFRLFVGTDYLITWLPGQSPLAVRRSEQEIK